MLNFSSSESSSVQVKPAPSIVHHLHRRSLVVTFLRVIVEKRRVTTAFARTVSPFQETSATALAMPCPRSVCVALMQSPSAPPDFWKPVFFHEIVHNLACCTGFFDARFFIRLSTSRPESGSCFKNEPTMRAFDSKDSVLEKTFLLP